MSNFSKPDSYKRTELLQKIENLQTKIFELTEQLDMANLVFDHIQNGALLTDLTGHILQFNRPYGQFMGVKREDMIGENVVDVIDNTRMHIVAKTGEPEIMSIQHIRGTDLVVQRIPIKKNGDVKAVFGQIMFKSTREFHELVKSVELMQSRVKLYEQELTSLRKARYTLENIRGTSETLTRLKSEAQQAAKHSLPVLITGESGTGKEVFSQAIHNDSKRQHKPFVRINCSAIPKDLFESELFGYSKGAFTGALTKGKPGKFELAQGGTLFLDEIGDMPLEMQPKLLQVLEEKVFERVGGINPIRTECRVITATNRNLQEMLEEKTFRKDLFFRLNVVPIHITPLRDRTQDILPIATYLIEQISQDFGVVNSRLTDGAARTLVAYDWPGNVRELYNVLERTLSHMQNSVIRSRDLPLYLKAKRNIQSPQSDWDLRVILSKTEKKLLSDALLFTHNNKAKAAELLGIDRTNLYRKLNKHNIHL